MKKVFKLKWILLVCVLVVGFAGYFVFTGADSKTPVAHAGGKVYEGTMHLSSMGGFMVLADLKIDPLAERPIHITGDLKRLFIKEGPHDITIAKKYYANHGPIIDHEKGHAYWAAYFVDDRDPAKKGVRYGKYDIKTGKVLFDGLLPLEPRNTAPIQYCAVGQAKDKVLLVMMGFETFIDIIDKDTMKHERRVFLDDIPDFKAKKYLWTHGINSPDMKEFALVTSLTDEGGKFPRGEETRQRIFILDMKSLLEGKVKVLRDGTITADPKKSALFRLRYTPDGKYILLSNRDRSNVLDAKTLKEVALKIIPEVGWENHEFVATPDGKYGILTQRVPIDNLPGQEPKKVIDGWLELVDMTKLAEGKLTTIGKPTPICSVCHLGAEAKAVAPWKDKLVPAVTCGFDMVWKK